MPDSTAILVLWFGIVLLQASLPVEVSASPQQCPSQQLANTTIEIPFAYPNRPTVYVSIGGETIPLLFDTGTNRSILLDTGPGSLPSGLVFDTDQLYSAQLDGKPPELVQNGFLRYASSDKVMLADRYVQSMQFRVYRAKANTGQDFQGALSPLLFAKTHLIEITNSKSIIRLVPKDVWKPKQYTLDLPLVVLPRGIFIPLFVDGSRLWFQLDTGFSGELAVTPESMLGVALPVDGGESEQSFRGWGRKFELTPCSVTEAILQGYNPDKLPAINRIIHIKTAQSYLLPDSYYPEITSLEIGGIVGAGFLCKFDYALDLSNGWLYIQLESQDGVAQAARLCP